MLIFDRFPNEEKAREFMAAITKEFGLTTHFVRSEDGYLFGENQKINNEAPMRGALEVFPFELKPPIVLIERHQRWRAETTPNSNRGWEIESGCSAENMQERKKLNDPAQARNLFRQMVTGLILEQPFRSAPSTVCRILR